jgi:hypothetical protein
MFEVAEDSFKQLVTAVSAVKIYKSANVQVNPQLGATMGLHFTTKKFMAALILSVLLFTLFAAYWFDLTIWLLENSESGGFGIAIGFILLFLLLYVRAKHKRRSD